MGLALSLKLQTPSVLFRTPTFTMDGKYTLKSNENYDAFLKAVGVPDELAAKMVAAVPTVEVSTTATTSTMVVKAGDKTYTNTITYGQDSPSDIAGLKYTVNVKLCPDGYSGSISLGGKTGTIEVKKTADGYCQCMTVGGVTCKRYYKKC